MKVGVLFVAAGVALGIGANAAPLSESRPRAAADKNATKTAAPAGAQNSTEICVTTSMDYDWGGPQDYDCAQVGECYNVRSPFKHTISGVRAYSGICHAFFSPDCKYEDGHFVFDSDGNADLSLFRTGGADDHIASWKCWPGPKTKKTAKDFSCSGCCKGTKIMDKYGGYAWYPDHLGDLAVRCAKCCKGMKFANGFGGYTRHPH